MNDKIPVRVRIAPSPTGTPHIGNTRTSLFNYLFAKHNDGKFILRIEDTDQKRSVEGSITAIKEILEWLSLAYDEYYVQSERKDIYKEHARLLLDKKIAYEKDGAIWVKMPTDRDFSWTDAVGEKNITFKGDSQQDFVALKSDGFPTYHLANVVDDHLMGISHIIRGEEWISSTPKHLFLYKSFEWEPPVFAHLPVILGTDKAKLSKRHGAESALDYRDKGYLKEALLNFMALLGWNPGGDKEIMDLSTMVDLFKLEDVNTKNPIFDVEKLSWLNGVYIRNLDNETLKREIENIDGNLNLNPNEFNKLLDIAKTRMKTLKDFKIQIEPFLSSLKLNLTSDELSLKTKLKDKLLPLSSWTKEEIGKAIKDFIQENKIDFKTLYKILTGNTFGLPISDMFEVLGKEKTLSILS